jgi:hypothetical protein
MTVNVYGISEEKYQELLAWQGDKCYMCGRKPQARRLAIDHDHKCCPGKISCGKCVRGLLCADNDRGCNHTVLGNITGIPMAMRVVDYLVMSPFQRMLAGHEPPVINHREPAEEKIHYTCEACGSVAKYIGGSAVFTLTHALDCTGDPALIANPAPF